MDHHNHQENSLQPPQFTTATDAPPSFTGFSPPQPAPPPYPPYIEMITAAITSDNTQGKGGSSKRAIAKYIDRVYTDLPPSHSSLLTHYLKELKHNGYLVMVKNSYQLASVVAANPDLFHTGSAPQLPTLDLNTSQQFQLQPPGFVDPSPKRRPGRPPRTRTDPGLAQAQAQPQENGAGAGEGGGQSGSGKKRGRPPKQQVIRPHSNQAEHQIMMEPADIQYVHPMPQAEPMATDGFGVEERKRRPGRPPKLTPVVPLRRPAQLNGSAQVVVGSEQVVVKRKPGRPAKKNVDVVASGGVVGKPRGRPKRSGLGPVSRPVGKRPRGRPPRVGGGVVVVGKRRGRPAKVTGGPPKVRRLSVSGKPMGRPRKNAASLNQVSEQTANEELTKKLELIQSKVRDAVDVLRPYIPRENAPMMALQQLEELAAPILTAPQMAPPVMTEIEPMPVNMNAPPPPTGTISGPPPESVSAPPYMNVPGPFSLDLPQMTITEPFQVPSSFENQQRMSWMSSNEPQS